jgi:hypothetical protein
MARDEIIVATVLALSWNPFRKSNSSAVATNIIRKGDNSNTDSLSIVYRLSPAATTAAGDVSGWSRPAELR